MSSISIKQLPKVNEINSNDLLLIQTPTASNTLEFKDLIIGLENTTFANTISTFNTEIEAISANVLTLSSSDITNTAAIATNLMRSSVNTANIAMNTTNLGLSAAVIDANTAAIAANITNIAAVQTGVIDTANTPTVISTTAGADINGVPITIAGVSYYIMLSAVPVA